ncbi:MAG: DNA mismatch repair protein MutS [Clostridiaceae bacterium]
MALTPMMVQYFSVKEKCKDAILFYRLGDFYEMFFEDAKIASKELELVLTGRNCGLEEKAPMCGIPYHAANNYILRLVNKGYKVAICEQLEDPKAAKGIVKRDIIKIVTPGTYTDSSFLEDTKNNYIMSIYYNEKDKYTGISFADISTGEFLSTVALSDLSIVYDEISKFDPKEMIIVDTIDENVIKEIKERFPIYITVKDETYFRENARENTRKTFTSFNEDYYEDNMIYSVNALLNYIYETQKASLSNIFNIEVYNVNNFLTIDINSRRNLEITETLRDKTKKGSLLWILDKTSTAMGGREIRRWLEQPLINKTDITERLDAVEEIKNNIALHEEIKANLKDIYDIERIVGKVSAKSVNAKELLALKMSIGQLPSVKTNLLNFKTNLLSRMYSNLDLLEDVYKILDSSIKDSPSLSVKDGDIIKEGFNEEIDSLRQAKLNGKKWIAALEQQEKQSTGIKSLKVSYNGVFGYYIEVTKTNLDLVPENYIRKQTLANAERYITEELKEMESKILGAEEKLLKLEYSLFIEIRDKIESEVERMKKSAKILAQLDSLSSLAKVALDNNYCKPKINEKGEINIKEGRHPVVEKMIPSGGFISNDSYINEKDQQLILITGPNMAGKSTYMRQIALITIMAQMGSFIPAKEANLSICDKVYTRIGASDDLANGKSTFMVEMWEVANILKNATKNSLILLDEVGRGTSTYDGLSIAWSVIEYICNNPDMKSKTLFATHYHELVNLEGKVDGVVNYSVSVKKIGKEIAFLRKIVRGGADESYGIEVAKLAGLPEQVLSRARTILKELEFNQKKANNIEEKEALVSQEISLGLEGKQMDFNELEKDNLICELKNMDLLNMTPIECLNKLNKICEKAKFV